MGLQLVIDQPDRQIIRVAGAPHQDNADPPVDFFLLPGKCFADGVNPIRDILPGKSWRREESHSRWRLRFSRHSEGDDEMVFQ